jgi:hypothetical protein
VTVTSNDGMLAAFYTHVRDLPAWMRMGATVGRGDYLDDISPTTGAPHLHLALAENVRGTFTGLNLFDSSLRSPMLGQALRALEVRTGPAPSAQAREPSERTATIQT